MLCRGVYSVQSLCHNNIYLSLSLTLCGSWPNLLLARMQRNRQTATIAVLNQAAGGNRVLHDGLGPNVISRLDRDVLAQSGVRYVLVYEGVNDIGVAAPDAASQKVVGDRLIAAYRQIVTRLHTFGIPVFGATITPFGTPAGSQPQAYSDPERERTRQRVNAWIRSSSNGSSSSGSSSSRGVFDAVVDFDRVLCSGDCVDQLAPQYDSGDHLHPNVRAFQALADSFSLELFSQFADGVERV